MGLNFNIIIFLIVSAKKFITQNIIMDLLFFSGLVLYLYTNI